MARTRSRTYARIIQAVLAKYDVGIRYDLLVNIAAETVDEERAKHYRLHRLKRTPNETPAETIWKGQQGIARKYIDAAQRYGRIEIVDGPKAKTVWAGTPTETGGPHSKPRTWAEEKDALSRQQQT